MCAFVGPGQECAFAQASCTSQNDSVGQPESGFPSLEGFEMLRELGMGTFARCYLAKDNSSGELCAVKVQPHPNERAFHLAAHNCNSG